MRLRLAVERGEKRPMDQKRSANEHCDPPVAIGGTDLRRRPVAGRNVDRGRIRQSRLAPAARKRNDIAEIGFTACRGGVSLRAQWHICTEIAAGVPFWLGTEVWSFGAALHVASLFRRNQARRPASILELNARLPEWVDHV